eukprot:scaffold912_cov187-Ochromonas_danica.AAC.43
MVGGGGIGYIPPYQPAQGISSLPIMDISPVSPPCAKGISPIPCPLNRELINLDDNNLAVVRLVLPSLV